MTDNGTAASSVSPRAIVGGIALYIAGGLFWAFLPFFVSLQTERAGLSTAAAGFLGTAYLAGFTFSSMAAMWWARRFDLRRCVLAAVLVIVAAFLVLGLARIFLLGLLACFLIGIAMGALWVIAYRLFGQARNPDRTFALAIGISYPALALVTLVASRVVIPHYGLVGVMATIALLVGILGFGGTQLPRGLATPDVDGATAPRKGITLSGILALAGLFLTGFAFACIWSLAARIGLSLGFDEGRIGPVLSSNLLMTGVGSLTASFIGTRLGRTGPLVGALSLLAICMVALQGGANFGLFAGALLGLGFGMGIAIPFQLAAVAATDRDGRLVSLLAAVQGLGTALAPPCAGLLFDAFGVAPVVLTGLTAILLSMIAFLLATGNQHSGFQRV